MIDYFQLGADLARAHAKVVLEDRACKAKGDWSYEDCDCVKCKEKDTEYESDPDRWDEAMWNRYNDDLSEQRKTGEYPFNR